MTDPDQGGLRGAPKFPNPPIYRFLWQNAFRTGDPAGSDALHLMLERMSQGGIYDHLGGGYRPLFHRRHLAGAAFREDAVRQRAVAGAAGVRPCPPAQPAVRPARRGNRRLDDARHDRAARSTARPPSPRRKMPTARARKAASTSGPKPRSTPCSGRIRRLQARLRRDADRQLGRPHASCAGSPRLARRTRGRTGALPASILFQAREKRVRPGWDDKVLADWNGLADRRSGALHRGVRPARLAGSRTGSVRLHPGPYARQRMAACRHAWRMGRVTAPGMIEDQAAMARAALALHEATARSGLSGDRERLVDAAQAPSPTAHGGFFSTAADAADVPLARPRTAADNATPAGNGIMAEVMAKLFHLTGDPAWRARATRRAHRLRRRPGTARRHAHAAGRRRPAGGRRQRGRRRCPGRSPSPAASRPVRPRSGRDRATRAGRQHASRRTPGLRQGHRPGQSRCLCLPPQRLRPADHRSSRIGASPWNTGLI